MRNLRPVALPAVFALTLASELAVPAAAHCPHDNLLRCFIRSPTLAITFCSWTAGIYPTASTIYATTTWTPEPTTTSTCIASSSPADTSISSSSHGTSSTFITQTAPAVSTSPSISTIPITGEPVVPSLPTTTLRPWRSSVNASRPDQSSSVPVETATLGGMWEGAPCETDEESPDEQRTTARTTSFASSAPLSPRTGPKTSLACLEDLEPDNEDITSACSCFSHGYSIAPVTSTVTAYPGPTCAGGQPTFPNCFDDFHPYNCGTDAYGVVACSCALTTEDTAACTLGDYERDNACLTSDDCAEGWHCTLIDCFDDDVLSVCTQQCPELFSVNPAGVGQFRIAAPPYSPAGQNLSDLSIVVGW